MLIDTHCHLNFNAFDSDRDKVLERARESGVGRILIPGVDITTSYEAVSLSASYAEVFAAVGVHPNESSGWDNGALNTLRDLTKMPKVVAIGEIGLDYYRDRAPKELQQRVFRDQLSLAAELDLPVIIHSRNASAQDVRAFEDIISILTEWVSVLNDNDSSLRLRPGVLHSFSSDCLAAKEVMQNNFMIGITGPVTFRNAETLRDVVKSTPLEQQLVETDAPFLTPHPYRGKRNEPAHVQFVAEKIAQIHGESYENVVDVLSNNSERLFNW